MIDFKEIIPNVELWDKVCGWLIIIIVTIYIYLKGRKQ
ncbi:hypothetical protein LCGC14_1554620 [marine sediment metagenome]|uniref:Uncharacterized protein n=1 Tax=marine sediment metagenome TaxID=412755 RepID=A0A0F9JAA1_9ZZZZ